MYQSSKPRDLVLIYKLVQLPWFFIITMTAIVLIGCAMLYSAAGGDVDPWASRQFIRFAMAIPLMLIIALIDIRFWFKYAYVMYVGGLGLLVLVAVMGVEGGLGAQRWLNIGGFQFQPSELAKVGLVLAMARYYHMLNINSVKKLWSLIIPAALIGMAALLILKQPNLGTAAIVCMLGAAMLFFGGVSWKLFILGFILVGTAIPVGYEYVLHDYQKDRIDTFLDPESDPLGKGYNIIQSKIAIGSGGMTGKGFIKGTQSQLAFVPESQTDFIFSIFAEEFGFVGGLVLLALYGVLLFNTLLIAVRCESVFARMVAMGVGTMLFLHVLINMGMVMGLLPVVGVPLPLLSYGGSSMISTLIGFGFILNANIHRNVRMRSQKSYTSI